MTEMHEANRAFWNASTPWWQEREDTRGHWQHAHEDPSLVFAPAEMPYVRDIAGRDVCVLGSGDNEAAFALAGLGGRVTSVDISEARLAVAAERARALGLTLTFLRADVVDLAALTDATFDLVYTGGHMSIWISDIRRYYAEAARILRPGGRFVVSEYHPFRRLWLDGEDPAPHHHYLNRGPYRYETDEGQPTFEYHWTVADHIQAVIDGGCRVVAVDEFGETVEDEFWMQVTLENLPACLLIVGERGVETPG